MKDLVLDLRVAFRRCARRPVFSLTVVALLGVGLGANTVVYSLARRLVFEPVPYAEPTRLTMLWSDLADYERAPISGPELHDLRTLSATHDEFASIWASTAPGARYSTSGR